MKFSFIFSLNERLQKSSSDEEKIFSLGFLKNLKRILRTILLLKTLDTCPKISVIITVPKTEISLI